MYSVIKSIHSFLPYLFIAALLASVLVFMAKRFGNREFKKGDKTLALVTLILTHLQVVIGLILYFISPIVKRALSSGELMSDKVNRFYAVEHISIMIIAAILITIGYSRAKRKENSQAKFQSLFVFYALGLILALTRIPWDTWLSL